MEALPSTQMGCFRNLRMVSQLVCDYFFAVIHVLMSTVSHKCRGVISTCQAATTTWAGEMVLRFLLGVFEGKLIFSMPR